MNACQMLPGRRQWAKTPASYS